MTSLWRRIIAGDDWRPTRLHDEKGNLIQGSEWCYLLRAAVVCLKRVLFDKVDEVPWWTFGWMRRVERIVRPDMAVIEFGSGNSTLWLAGRVAALTSIEHHPDWHGFVAGKLTERGAGHVDYQLRDQTGYADCSMFADASFDLAIVDGEQRGACVRNVWPKMKPGAWIYLDNSDKDARDADDGANLRAAENFLCASTPADRIETRTGITIGSLNAHEAMLVQVPEEGEG